MKYLINKSFKVVRKGEFVKAAPEASEFILDTKDEKNCPALGVLIEVDNVNKLGILAKYKKSKIEYLAQIHEKLESIKMTEQNQETLTDKAVKIIKELHAAAKTKEDMVVALIQAGMKLAPASKLIKSELTNLGAILSTKDRKGQGSEILAAMPFEPKSAEDVLAAIARLKDELPQTDEKAAMLVIRAYAKEKGIELPKRAKGAGNLRATIMGWMESNPTATKEEFVKFMESKNRNEKAISRIWETFTLAQKMAAKIIASQNTTKAAKAA